jgi:hypothetical protein
MGLGVGTNFSWFATISERTCTTSGSNFSKNSSKFLLQKDASAAEFEFIVSNLAVGPDAMIVPSSRHTSDSMETIPPLSGRVMSTVRASEFVTVVVGTQRNKRSQQECLVRIMTDISND